MAKTWGGKTFDSDFFEINAGGERINDQKDWAASEGWTNANEPWRNTPGWHGQPLSAEQERQGRIDQPGVFAERDAWRAANPTNALGAPIGPPNPWSGGSTPAGPPAAAPTPTQDYSGIGAQVSGPAPLAALAPMGPLGGIDQLGRVSGPNPLAALGAAPRVEAAGPASALGQQVRGSISQGLADPAVDTTDPAYRAQVDAYNRNSQRSAERLRASTAQRMLAQGTLGSGAFDAAVNRVLQNQGTDEADFESRLMASELAAGRDRQSRAQQLGAGLLSQEQQQSLAERLANQSGALQGMGWTNQRDLAQQSSDLQLAGLNAGREQANQQAMLNLLGINNQRDLAQYQTRNQRDLAEYGGQLQAGLANQDSTMRQRGYDLQRQLGLGDLGLRGQQIGNQNNQFYDSLAQQLGITQAELNQRAMLSLLGR